MHEVDPVPGDVSPKAMNLLLRFIYTNTPMEDGRLPGWLMRQIPDGVEEVFDAADRFLVFPLKVSTPLFQPAQASLPSAYLLKTSEDRLCRATRASLLLSP